jgi:hypothetical protein
MKWATGSVDLGKAPTHFAIVDHLMGDPPLGLYVQVPPSAELVRALAFDARSPIAVTDDPLQAQYVLAGAIDGKTPRYCWMLPNATRADTEGASPLPVRSDWFADAPADSLRQRALALAKVRGWLQLEPPPDDGFFPYTLHLRSVQTGELHTADRVVEGESYDLVLQADPKRLAQAVERRYVYVFALNTWGESVFLYPLGGDAVQLPPDSPSAMLDLNKTRFKVTPPFGIDTFVLLTSLEPIPDAEYVLASKGARTRGGASANESALSEFLDAFGGGRTRGMRMSTPASWSLQRMAVRSVER